MEFIGSNVTDKIQPVTAINNVPVPFSIKYALKVRYKCKDCEKITEEEGYPLQTGNFIYDASVYERENGEERHLVCKDCYQSYEEPDYEPDPDWEEEEHGFNLKKNIHSPLL